MCKHSRVLSPAITTEVDRFLCEPLVDYNTGDPYMWWGQHINREFPILFQVNLSASTTLFFLNNFSAALTSNLRYKPTTSSILYMCKMHVTCICTQLCASTSIHAWLYTIILAYIYYPCMCSYNYVITTYSH